MNCKPVFLFLLFLVIIFSVFYPEIEKFTDKKSNKEKSVCQSPKTKEECRISAIEKGHEIGGGGYDFTGDYNTKGCYVYSSGVYKNKAYWGPNKSGSEPTGIKKRVCVQNKSEPPMEYKEIPRSIIPKHLQNRDITLNTYLMPYKEYC